MRWHEQWAYSLQADADLDMTIVRGLRRRQPAIDIQSADDAGLRGVPDADVLAFCARLSSLRLPDFKVQGVSHMLTHRLQEAIQIASQLPPDEQDALAAKIESAVKDALWDALLNDPRADALLQQMIADAEKEEALRHPRRR